MTFFFKIQYNVIGQHYHLFMCLLCLTCSICFCFHRDTFVLCLLNGGTSFVAGFAIFSVLGFMSYEQGLPISEVAATGKTTAVFETTLESKYGCNFCPTNYLLVLFNAA